MLIEINESNLFLLLGAALRYSMGRRTYITATCANWLIKYSPHLSKQSVTMLHKELNRELEYAESNETTLGMQIDHDNWAEARDYLAKLLKDN